MSQIITCPQMYEFGPRAGMPSVFIAGGITACADWQKEMIKRLVKEADDADVDIALLNPRRNDFDVTNPDMSKEQIEWEYIHLSKADIILFWFPYETLCPITLFELGKAVGQEKEVLVGCHPGYGRKFDVEYQLSLICPWVKVHDNFQDLIDNTINWAISY